MPRYKSALRTKWNTESERIVKEIGEKAEGYIWMCDRDITYYSRWSTFFAVISGILALIVGTAQIMITNIYTDVECIAENNGTDNSFNCTTNKYPNTILGVINYIIAGLIAIIKLNNFDSFVDRLKTSSRKFRDIQSDVQQQLSMQRIDRYPAKDYIKLISKQYNKVVSNNEFKIRRSVAKKFATLFSKTDISMPEIAGDIKKINVAGADIEMGRFEVTESSDYEHNETMSGSGNEVDSGNVESSPSSTDNTTLSTSPTPKIPNIEDSAPPNGGSAENPIPHSDGSSKERTRVTISDETQSDRKRPSRKRSHPPKSPRKSATTYMGLQHHNHQPNLQAINFQLSRFAD